MKYLTREEAIDLAGLANVEAVDKINCQETNRVMDDGTVEFAAILKISNEKDFTHRLPYDVFLTAYYYQDVEDVASHEDLSDLDWTVWGYVIE